jgi:enoyl-CoA hydratase
MPVTITDNRHGGSSVVDHPSVRFDIHEGSAQIRLSRPSTRNALNHELLESLLQITETLARDSGISSLILTGDGGGFCSGMDLQLYERNSRSQAELVRGDMKSFLDLGGHVLSSLRRFPGLSIALVEGFAIGGGLLLAAGCDFRLIETDAKLSIPEHNYGLPVTWGGLERLVQLVGESLTLDWALSGRTIGTEEALRSGLASRVGSIEELRSQAAEYAELARKSRRIFLGATKPQVQASVAAATPPYRLESMAALGLLAHSLDQPRG